MNNIPSSVPVFIEKMEQHEDEPFTRAKLKVFYVGETADHRLFTKGFSDEVIKSLPLTPVVGYYSEETDDFIGHNDEQYIYGLVPETAKIDYEKDEDSGNTFVITDVILYTGRKDNIGTVASKIVGKQHSLELNPDTLEYTINRDNQGRFLNIEFKHGSFIGLSVLGDNETPAFTGSCFFSVNKDFKEVANECKADFDKFLNLLNTHGGNIKVFNSEEFFGIVRDKFAKVTMQEFQQKIYTALSDIGAYGWLVENTEDYAIVSCWNEAEERSWYLKYTITMNDENLTLSDPVEVKCKFLTSDEIAKVDESAPSANAELDEEATIVEDVTDASVNDDAADPEPAADDVGDDDDVNANADTEGAANATSITETITEEELQKTVAEATASIDSTTLSDSEKQELENYRKQEKIVMINDYSGDLSQEIIDKYIANVDNYSKEDLEAQLAIEYRKYSKLNSTQATEEQPQEAAVAFRTITSVESYDETNPADVVNKYNK